MKITFVDKPESVTLNLPSELIEEIINEVKGKRDGFDEFRSVYLEQAEDYVEYSVFYPEYANKPDIELVCNDVDLAQRAESYIN